ncbi:MAG: NAD-binding protein [Anaerolineae bacterium]|nr:NAD-binding protein [Anaerolineae bacterium]
MKSIATQLFILMRSGSGRRNLLRLGRFLLFLAALVTLYSVLFHYIMEFEGRQYSWVTGYYWTLTVMSTLGFGDITFESDLGRIFSSIVLLSGIIFLLVLLPFTFLEFFYLPFMKARSEARAPHELHPKYHNHVILTSFDIVTRTLIKKLVQRGYHYVILIPNLNDALLLYEEGYRVMVGELDDHETYRKARADKALLVATTTNDMVNTNIVFTVREVAEHVPIVAIADSAASVDILELAGCNNVLLLADMMGRALARRVNDRDRLAHIIGEFGELLIAESTTRNTPLQGKTLRESRLRENLGITALGIWEQGEFTPAQADTKILPESVLVLAGLEQAIDQFNETYTLHQENNGLVIIIGGGRVGRAAARALAERGIDYRIIEQVPEEQGFLGKYVIGNAAELKILEKAGIQRCHNIIVTTHDDDNNIYLTLYCRRLRPNTKIISRATRESNIATLYRAGADFVMSYATLGANTILNLLDKSNVLMISEGLDVIRVKIPPRLVGQSIAQAQIREQTECTIVAIQHGGKTDFNLNIQAPMPDQAELIMLGTRAAEEKFRKKFKA